MSQDLPLHSFEVEGYRGIRHLRLPELGRVNLFVGKNNAGKSSLLEAIRLFSDWDPGSGGTLLFELLREHSDFEPRFRVLNDVEHVESSDLDALLAAAESLFHGGFEDQPLKPIRLSLHAKSAHWIEIYGPRQAGQVATGIMDDGGFLRPDSPLFAARTKIGVDVLPIAPFLNSLPRRFRSEKTSIFVPAGGLRTGLERDRWDRVALAGRAELVENAMRTLLPNLSRVLTAGESGTRSIFIKLHNISRAVPLQSLGDGVVRVFAISVALVLAEGGVLLIDEVENGLHHSVQAEVWNSVFALSEQLNVQVFATSHSWDAVVGFQNAANLSLAKGMLYRLEREEDNRVYAERYTEHDVAVAAEQQVEVR